MENYNNRKDIDDEDLKFMPLKVEESFYGDKSNWFPLVSLDSPNINNFINNFVFGFSMPMIKEKIDDNFHENIQKFNNEKNNNSKYNSKPNNKFKEIQDSQNNDMIQNCNNLGFNYCEYPKESYGEELMSYEKGYIQNYNKALNENDENQDELPHIKILREGNFFELAEEGLRDNNKEKINDIFNRIGNSEDSILNIFNSYEIPYPMTAMIVKKIIKDVLYYK